MKTRINLNQIDPEAYKAMMGLENYIHKSGLDKKYYELIKIRTSQINGCAYCLDMHTRDARKLGETEQRIYVLPRMARNQLFHRRRKSHFSIDRRDYQYTRPRKRCHL